MFGPFCANCGQHAIDYRRSFGRVLLDVLDSFLNWDSKFVASVGLLIVRPWRLTIDFLAGKRVRYVHPVRLYLLVSIVFFFGVHELARHANLHAGTKRDMTPEQRAKMEQKLARLPPEAQAEVRDAVENPAHNNSFFEIGTDAVNPKASPFEKWLNQRVKEKIGEHGVNLKVFFLTLVSNLPAMMLCCIPLFAFVLKILYLRRRSFYIDHFIYALHIHAFAYMAILLIGFASAGMFQIVPTVAGWILAILIATAIGLLLVSIRRVYRQNWFVTVLKFFVGGFVYFVVLLLALAATFFVTLALPS